MTEKNLISFITYINKLDMIEFIGISKILCVAVYKDKNKDDDKKEIRNYEDILSDLIDNYCKLGRKQRREIDNLLKKINKRSIKEAMPNVSLNDTGM